MTASARAKISLLLGFALLGFTQATTLACPSGFDEHLGKCYKLNITHTRWKEARARCILDGAKLVEPRNQAEFDLIKNLYGKAVGNIWLGISDLGHEGTFTYASDGIPITFESWSAGQPDDWRHNEDCVHFQAASAGDVGPMNDIDCNTHWFAYVCETPKRSSECSVCPLPGYRPLTTQKCYKLVEDGTTWTDAVKACTSGAGCHGKLAEPRNKLEFALFNNIFGGIAENIWLGITDQAKEGTFVYQSDGSALCFSNWGGNQPDDWHGNEDCVHFQAPGGRVAPMNDINCHTDWFSRVCETGISPSLGEFNKLLIVSGTIFSGVPHIPEFIDLASSTTVCNTPPLYPPKVSYDADAVGTFIGSKALVCGGRLGGGFKNWKTHRECYFFDGCNGGWSRGPDLPDERYGARGVMLDDKRWWIVGGAKAECLNCVSYRPEGLQDAWVYHADTGTFETYGRLPVPMIGHFCAAKLGPNKVLVHREFADVKNTYLFDIITKKFTEIDKPVQIKSYGISCGTITLPNGTQEVILTAGSAQKGGRAAALATEIFSLSTMKWRSGPDFPFLQVDHKPVYSGSDLYMVTHRRVVKFNAQQMVWEELPQTLAITRTWHTVVVVPQSFAVCT